MRSEPSDVLNIYEGGADAGDPRSGPRGSKLCGGRASSCGSSCGRHRRILIGPDHLFSRRAALGGSTQLAVRHAVHRRAQHHLSRSGLVAAGAHHRAAIALSIVYVGADNLLIRGRARRPGVIAHIRLHPRLRVANVLREMDRFARSAGAFLQRRGRNRSASGRGPSRRRRHCARGRRPGRRLAFAGSSYGGRRVLVRSTGLFPGVSRDGHWECCSRSGLVVFKAQPPATRQRSEVEGQDNLFVLRRRQQRSDVSQPPRRRRRREEPGWGHRFWTR